VAAAAAGDPRLLNPLLMLLVLPILLPELLLLLLLPRHAHLAAVWDNTIAVAIASVTKAQHTCAATACRLSVREARASSVTYAAVGD
jgi:hypothetical protein